MAETNTSANRQHPASEILYHSPENFPIPKEGFNHVEILECLLWRATGILRLIIDEADDNESAVSAVYGIIEQSTRVLEQWRKTSARAISVEVVSQPSEELS